MRIKDNINVFSYLEPYYKWNMVSIGISDRILIVKLEKTLIGYDYKSVVEFLETNNFFKDENDNIFYRLKNKNDEYITPQEFDSTNHNIRIDTIKRMINK
jgi:hypothetical protein